MKAAKKNVKERTRFSALLGERCPQCKEGKIFRYPAYNIFRYHETNIHCPNCGFRFEREPAFFTGAMYFSYFFNVAIILGIGLTVFVVWNNPPLWYYFASIFPVILLLLPAIFRYSRTLMLYFFGGV
ncbi:MAG TPA: DUF983 domain-containing protein [Cytophagales bacterium]|nr:DUF983 domain-containing protein [Cytophagales bacterium]